ncbi:hypothetical protein [Enterobacter roggenkampii]|uniref:hypothetical protein n=1 Tax=Enterobacter roggenkampii TaxID=1812935 RepID=UPI00200626BC|nr:hypothetical protein [Enterobacter roggenkampii]MCK7443816.1 hypothetical protein [Enterobacter roggenkampii]HDT2078990.1 hypothetical protein [Enterobacter roggenkampii]
MSLSDGVRVLLLTTTCYLLTFSYESGYFRYFELPNELINVYLKTLITFGFIFLSFTFVIFIPLANLISKIMYERKKVNQNTPINSTVLTYTFMFIVFFLYIIVFHHVMSLLSTILQFLFLLTLVANDILIPLLFNRDLLLSQSIDENAKEQSQSNVLNLFARATKTNFNIYLVLFMIAISISHLLGGLVATTSKLDLTCNAFVIYETQDSSVVVRLGDNKFKLISTDECLFEKNNHNKV